MNSTAFPVRVAFRGMSPSPAIEADIHRRAEALQRFHPRLSSCHVTVEAPHRHHAQGKIYAVKIDLHLPGAALEITHHRPHDHAHEDVYVAIRDAFDALTRRLEDAVRRMRGDVKQHAPEA